jgi:quercetin dioxygenase-like cupin family protein
LEKKRERVLIYSINGKKSQLSYIKLKPGEVINHHHPHEQSGYILKGKVEITIGNEKKT